MSPLLLILTTTMPLVALVGLLAGGASTWALPLEVFGVLPLVELALPARPTPPMGEGSPRWQVTAANAAVYAMVPIQWGLVLTFVVLAAQGAWPSSWELLGATLSVGICCGAIGINVGHELGHRAGKVDRFLAKVLLLSSLYQHFTIEHNRGHHARVATAEDPASAARGVILYEFWGRSVVGGWRSAWDLEARRLHRLGLHAWTWRNDMVRLVGVQGLWLVGVGTLAGPRALVLVVAAALVGALLLETVNYIEHYGLRRELTTHGYERVKPLHSWNSNHPISRVLLFELTRHSDHHAHPGRRWSELRHFENSPQLPTGYPGLILLALLPPLWFHVMDRHLDRETARLAKLDPATA